MKNTSSHSSIIQNEINHFSALAQEWWDPRGPMAPLHAMNPLRTNWIKNTLPPEFSTSPQPHKLLDIGCGAGLASEAFATLGFETLGVDASQDAIQAARDHLSLIKLPPYAASLSYHAGSAEELLEKGASFNIVTALEVIEHVRNPRSFLSTLSQLTRPGGVVAISTLNRTIKSYLMAKLGAEYLLRLLPVGTHDWNKFIQPTELAQMAQETGLRLLALKGMVYSQPYWKESHDCSVNYIALFQK